MRNEDYASVFDLRKLPDSIARIYSPPRTRARRFSWETTKEPQLGCALLFDLRSYLCLGVLYG